MHHCVSHPGSHRPRGDRAFTLTELLVAVALTLVLMLAVAYIFSTTSEVVGVGNATAGAVRQSQNAQAIFADDFNNIVPAGQSPAMVIHGEINARQTTPVYASKVDESVGTAAQFRTDTLAFFRSGNLRRLTANKGSLSSPTRSDLAWVYYGHLAVPDSAGNPCYPGQVAAAPAINRDNFYASQWRLGRNATLCKDPNAIASMPAPVDDCLYATASSAYDLSPLGYHSAATKLQDTSTQYYIEQSRYDLAATTLSSFKATVVFLQTKDAARWWWPLMTQTDTTSGGNTGPYSGTTPFSMRYQCNPFPPRPLDPSVAGFSGGSASLARLAPMFTADCSDFRVEFAGDFMTQDAKQSDPTYGDVTNNVGDGELDFQLTPENDTSGNPLPRSQWLRSIRWYGLPRDMNGDGVMTAYAAGVKEYQLPDVVPVRDALATGGFGPASFEASAATDLPPPTGGAPYTLTSATTYTCAFGPTDPHPKLIRITVTLRDPNRRIPDGQTVQWVFPCQ